MKAKPIKSVPARRGFLLGASAAGAAGAAVIATNGGALPAVAQAPQPVLHPKGGGGYHLSEHVRQYYRTAFL